MVLGVSEKQSCMSVINASDNVGKGWLTKREIAERYNLSERQIDYLREKEVLPFYVVPSRCIRFDPDECDEAMKRFRRNWNDDLDDKGEK